MGASSQIHYYTGASPGTASSDVTGITIRHKRADDLVQNLSGPIPLPTSGLNFGWRKSSKINWSDSPSGSISNLRWFLSSLPATRIGFYARVQSAGIYVQASSADEAGISGFTDTAPNRATNDATLYTSSSPLVINAGTVLSNPDTGEGSQNFVETQMSVSTAYVGGPGPITSFSVTLRYTET